MISTCNKNERNEAEVDRKSHTGRSTRNGTALATLLRKAACGRQIWLPTVGACVPRDRMRRGRCAGCASYPARCTAEAKLRRESDREWAIHVACFHHSCCFHNRATDFVLCGGNSKGRQCKVRNIHEQIKRNGVPYYDLRDWGEDDDFRDCFRFRLRGAKKFTEWFYKEIIPKHR